MLATLALLVCQNPQPSTILSLVGAQRDDDLPSGMRFTPDGSRLIVHNGLESGFSTITEIDVALGQVVARSNDFQECNSIAVSPDGLIALVPEEYSGLLRVLAVPGLQLTATVNISPSSGNDHFYAAVDSTGSRAVMTDDYGQRIWVIDLGAAVQERVVTLSVPQWVPNVQIGADDLSLPFGDGQALFTLDISTGLESPRTTVNAPGVHGGPVMSGDGSIVAVLSVDAATGAGYVERFAIPGLTSLGWVALSGTLAAGSLQLDEDGDRALIYSGNDTFVADLTTGALTPIFSSNYGARIDATGTRVIATNGPDFVVADAATGALLGSFPARGRDRNVSSMRLSPNGRYAAVVRRGSDRIEIFEISGAVPIRRVDVSSGFGEEADGPYSLVESTDGRKVAVVARDSDDLRVIGIDGPPAILGRVVLDRGPEQVARRADGRALVVHGRGASLSVVDLDVPVESARFPLPDAGYVVQPELQGTAAWVLVDGATSRSLVRMDTVNGAILATVALPGGAGVTSSGLELLATVLFDLRRSRAFVATPDTGELSLVDLSAAAIVSTVPVPTVLERAELWLRLDGATVYHRGSLSDVSAFNVSAQGFAPIWTWSCGTPTPNTEQRALLTLFDDERHLLCVGGCSSAWTILDAATGSPGGSIGYSSSVPSLWAFDDEVWVDFAGDIIGRFRASGGMLTMTGGEGHARCCSSMLHVRAIGRTVGVGEDYSHQWAPPDDRFFVLDFVQDVLACTPSVPNSTGVVSTLRIDGSGFAGAPLIVTVNGLRPGSMVGYLLAGSALTPPTPMTWGVGELCLGGTIARFSLQVQPADAAGRQRYTVNTGGIPTSTGATAVQPGSTWVFQSWHRDMTAGGAATSNTSTARTVRFD